MKRSMQYFDIQRHWTKRIVPYLADAEFNRVLNADMKVASIHWGHKFEAGTFPGDYGCNEWQIGHRGPMPRFWKYIQRGCCHWLVNAYLRLATLVVPGRPWRIVTSPKHSTVWDGDKTLFDPMYFAFDVDANECWRAARQGGQILWVGMYRPTSKPKREPRIRIKKSVLRALERETVEESSTRLLRSMEKQKASAA